MDLLREIALKIRNENMDVNYLASSVRLNKKLNRLGLTEGKIEKLLDETNIYCYRYQTDEKEFVSNIDVVFNLAFSLDISPYDVPPYINKNTMRLMELDKKIAEKEERIRQKAEEYGLAIEDLKEYRSNIPLVDKIEELKNHLRDCINKIYLLQKQVNVTELIKKLKVIQDLFRKNNLMRANKKLPVGRPLDIKELVRITDEIYFYPQQDVQIIRSIRQRLANSPS